ncbi:hypothetical protein B0189_00780 [Moraxella cuniculi]|nr:hypothetical protein B0189_00780 [Moraxella cuniculi]
MTHLAICWLNRQQIDRPSLLFNLTHDCQALCSTTDIYHNASKPYAKLAFYPAPYPLPNQPNH